MNKLNPYAELIKRAKDKFDQEDDTFCEEDPESGKQYLIKRIKSNNFNESNFKVLKTLSGNFVKVYYYDESEKLIVCEFCSTTAHDIRSLCPMTKDEVLIFFTACAEAVSFLHSQNIFCDDYDNNNQNNQNNPLNPENIYISQDGSPKLYLVSPTKVAQEKQDAYKQKDIWALGCTLYQLITGEDLPEKSEFLKKNE